jgi:hypothetical protein
MKSEEKIDSIVIELSKEEAIVLLEWLSWFNGKENSTSFQDQSEERVLWDLEVSLEKVVSKTFDANYAKILSKARDKVRD